MLRDPENVESNFIHNLLGPSAGTILEVGCGDGRLTCELVKIADSVLAIDPDADSIWNARHLMGKGVKLALGSGEYIPLPDRSIDTVVFSLSLHHHPNPANALSEARRILKDTGRILVLEPEAESPVNRLFRIIHDEDDAYGRAAEALEKCGARIEDRGSFTSTWQFENFGEMVAYLYSYFDLEPEPSQVSIMENTLGNRIEDCPLMVEDSTRWWLLASTVSA